MIILFGNNDIRKDCNDLRSMVHAFGQGTAKLLKRRLFDLDAASCLAEAFSLPGKLHPLTGNRLGQYAMHLNEGMGIIFEPANDPLSIQRDGTIDPEKVDTIRILEVTDYHKEESNR